MKISSPDFEAACEKNHAASSVATFDLHGLDLRV
jgi:hypothetical protein